MKKTVYRGLVVAAILAAVGAAVQAGTPSLVSIGVLDNVLDPAHPESAVKALAADGSCAVGYSMGPSVDGLRTLRLPVFWAPDTGLVKLPNPEPNGPGTDLDGEARGIVLRPLHNNGIGISGSIGYLQNPAGQGPAVSAVWMAYDAPRTNPGSGAWAAIPTYSPSLLGAYNTARRTSYGVSTDESWQMVGKRRNSSNGNWTNRASWALCDPFTVNDWTNAYCPTGATTGEAGYAMANSVSTGARNGAIGWDTGNTPCGTTYRAVRFGGITSRSLVIPGGSAIFSVGFGISENGNQLCGVDATAFTGTHAPEKPNLTATAGQAFVSQFVSGAPTTMTLLSNLPGDQLGTAIAINDFGTVVGFSSADGTAATEQAVIWDTSSIWDTTGQPKLLTDLLTGFGVDTSAWTKLTRVTSISDSGGVVAGWGVWAADGSTRGFVAKSPVELGACCFRTGFGTGTCSILKDDQCAAQGGTYLGTDSTCGSANANCGDFCSTPTDPWADTNLDKDVDQEDFGYFQLCYTGSATFTLSVGCACLDKFNAGGSGKDGFIDASDLQHFIDCVTGPTVSFNAAIPPPGCLP